MADRADYDAFVAATWHRLLRTAYLLTRDWAMAEDLVQTALMKAWLAWPRIGEEREAYVRKIIVNVHVSWWRRRWRQSEVSTQSPPDRTEPADHMGQVDEGAIVEALTRKDYACVVIGGGIRTHEPLLEFFEKVVNLVRQHAPDAAVAFNSSPEDCADAAMRWLRQGV
ncbi:sigma factor [Nonomuraea dietziae]|uniref:sigma factor n=1 Tax=Nonomuraea dietziae TaxID=65515 RepID=UPI0033D25200